MALTGKSNEEKIWNYLIARGLSKCGAAGLMGNIYAESALKPTNLQNSFEKKLGYTDESYTAAVDSGSYGNFVKDSAGYGLCQWTFWSRKQNLLEFARAAGKSIGDLEMQLDFLFKELEGYKAVLATLKTATSVRAASDSVLLNFERPADQSEAVQKKRAGYGQDYYDKYAGTSGQQTGGNTMSNSSLVDCVRYSPNHSGKRTHTLDTLTPHCVVGQLAAETIGDCFPKGREASCNYGIGYDGRVCLVVDECNRSWCTSSNSNDQRAVTIECASDKTEPYTMNNAVYEKLIKLCADICKRNGKTKVLWLGSKEKTLAYTPKSNEMVLTAHRWFANKSCPGEWLYSRYGELADRINKLLGTSTGDTGGSTGGSTGSGDIVYTVVKGDTLSGIAAKYGTTYQKLAEYNGIANPNVISVGQKIRIPSSGGSTAKPNTGGAASYKVGDIVQFKGSKHYTSANAASGPTCKAGPAKITAISAGAKHPYHVIHTDSTSNVYGWVDAADIGAAASGSTASKTQTHKVVKGDTLSALANKYGTTVAKILAANKGKYPSMTANYIVVGWTLTIPQ